MTTEVIVTNPTVDALIKQILDRALEYKQLIRQYDDLMNRCVEYDRGAAEHAEFERQWQLIVERLAAISDDFND
jgi:hypothetical protein